MEIGWRTRPEVAVLNKRSQFCFVARVTIIVLYTTSCTYTEERNSREGSGVCRGISRTEPVPLVTRRVEKVQTSACVCVRERTFISRTEHTHLIVHLINCCRLMQTTRHPHWSHRYAMLLLNSKLLVDLNTSHPPYKPSALSIFIWADHCFQQRY